MLPRHSSAVLMFLLMLTNLRGFVGFRATIGSYGSRGAASRSFKRCRHTSASSHSTTSDDSQVDCAEEQVGDGVDWGKWEFGTWKVNSHAENLAEAAARAEGPARLPAEMGGGAGLGNQSQADLDGAIAVLQSFVSAERLAKMLSVLEQRTRSVAMVFENPSNPNNVWACLRTLDSFGLQHAHVVSDPDSYSKKARLKTMCAAMGSQKWLTLHGHNSPEDAVAKLKAEGYQVVASDLSPSAVPIRDVDWSGKTAVVLGNEERGISESMRQLADQTFGIPMRGFAGSFNMSVACSVILSHLSALSVLHHGDLPEVERKRIATTWLVQCVRGSRTILQRNNITLPLELWDSKTRSVAGYRVQ